MTTWNETIASPADGENIASGKPWQTAGRTRRIVGMDMIVTGKR